MEGLSEKLLGGGMKLNCHDRRAKTVQANDVTA
jgi:hypothetical protein